MKGSSKTITAIIMAIIAVTLTGCGNKTSNSATAGEVKMQTEAGNFKHPEYMPDNGKPTVIDFYATWCGPCKLIAPIFKQLKDKYGSEINFISIDTDENEDIAFQFGIESIPTFVFLDKDGKEISRIVGANEQELTSTVETLATNN